MKHVDLCSGIGGFALGFEMAKLSVPVLFCDVEPWYRLKGLGNAIVPQIAQQIGEAIKAHY